MAKTNPRSSCACIVEAHESPRKHLENSQSKDHEDRIAEKGFNSLSHWNLVHKSIPMRQAMKIPDAKATVDKEQEELEKILAWQLTKVRIKKEVIAEARKEGKTVHFASLMDVCHLKNSELEPKFKKTKTKDVLYSGVTVFTEQGSSASHVTAAKAINVIARLPGCTGQAADAASAKTLVKMQDAPRLLKFSKVRVSRYADTSSTIQVAQIMVQH